MNNGRPNKSPANRLASAGY